MTYAPDLTADRRDRELAARLGVTVADVRAYRWTGHYWRRPL